MISVSQAQQAIDQHTAALSPEAVPLAQAHGRVLREPVASTEDMPPFDRSAMDGYAVLEHDPADELVIVDEIRAGQTIDRELQPGQAVRIFTGARLPSSGLKVIMQEHVEAREGRIRVTKRIPFSNVRLRGEDARVGEILLEPGTTLDATAVALLASIGKISPLVSKQPRILHLTTGDEIVPPEQTPASGQIRNSNAYLISALCREFGCSGVSHYHAGDNKSALLEVVTNAKPETYDMVLISGGSGAGDYDFSAEVFRHLGATIQFREINVRPGKPLIFGTTGRGRLRVARQRAFPFRLLSSFRPPRAGSPARPAFASHNEGFFIRTNVGHTKQSRNLVACANLPQGRPPRVPRPAVEKFRRHHAPARGQCADPGSGLDFAIRRGNDGGDSFHPSSNHLTHAVSQKIQPSR